jgi:hypothetical protein
MKRTIFSQYLGLQGLLLCLLAPATLFAQKCGTVPSMTLTPGEVLYRSRGKGGSSLSFFKDGCWIIPGSPAKVFSISSPTAPQLLREVLTKPARGLTWFLAGDYGGKQEFGNFSFGSKVINFSALPDITGVSDNLIYGVKMDFLDPYEVSAFPYSDKIWKQKANFELQTRIKDGMMLAIGNLLLLRSYSGQVSSLPLMLVIQTTSSY